MSRARVGPNLRKMESLFAVERELIPVPDDVRNRIVRRARESLRRCRIVPSTGNATGPRRVKVGLAAAAIVMLSSLCALAYWAGYRARARSSESLSRQSTVVPSEVARAAVPSVIVAIVPVTPSASSLVTGPESPPLPHPGRATPGATKASIDLETYSRELRVLQPARQAVARQDYGAALVAISEHQSSFPSGKLTEEREALRVKALLGLGRTADARRAGAAFRARFPRSALLGRIDDMLGSTK